MAMRQNPNASPKKPPTDHQREQPIQVARLATQQKGRRVEADHGDRSIKIDSI
jgi:hypothetical protein